MRLTQLNGLYVIVRLDSASEAPTWARPGQGILALTWTAAELSVVAPESAVPPEVEASRGWTAFEVGGPLDLGMIGVISDLSTALADAAVPLFALSTHDTDYLLVPESTARTARKAWRSRGHAVDSPAG